MLSQAETIITFVFTFGKTNIYWGILDMFLRILELVSKELNYLAAILHVYAGGLIFMK